jgi:hypothetical protein
LSLAALVPLLSISIELALIGVVALELRNAIHCFGLVSALVAPENSTARPEFASPAITMEVSVVGFRQGGSDFK